MYTYLILNLASLAFPLAFSFHKRLNFISQWKTVVPALILSAVPFIIWDILFTKAGIWGFNPEYIIGIYIYGLPLEEILFFFCIPFACMFIHYTIHTLFPELKVGAKSLRFIVTAIVQIMLMVSIYYVYHWYSVVNFIVFCIILSLAFKLDPVLVRYFLITFLFMLPPFFVVNGILTGTGIEKEVVWYNNEENSGFRLLTIPLEDVFYAFSMILLPLLINEQLKLRFHTQD